MLLKPLFNAKATNHLFKAICCGIFIILQSGWFTPKITAQSTTDPSQLNVLYDQEKLATVGLNKATNEINGRLESGSNQAQGNHSSARAGCSDAFIPRDGSYTEIGRNDDGSFGPITLPFTFSFCGTSYNHVWINTNGNLTFTGPLSTFTPSGFPISTPMVAPFWADVDTRCGGAIYYKLAGDHMIVTWDAVGFYFINCSLLNTFQVIISDGSATLPGGGNNVQFRYGDMQWTTGDASGGSGGFGGAPATVGFNAGDAVNYEQVGRFDHAGTDYDGPFGVNDGVSYLDNNCFTFNSAEDNDGDGITACFDCDDDNPDVYPGQTESCNGLDDNCDGVIDEGFDTDGDGYTSCGGDCDDSNNAINPDADEICDGIDNNCDGSVDEGFTNTDGDGQADCVDADDDNDGCLDADDSNPLEASGDADCDGIHDDCDICASGDDTVDNNNDGIPDCSQLLNYNEYSPAWYCASNKIAICHNGHTICVSKSAIPAHYAHGDNLGPCTSCDDRNVAINAVDIAMEDAEIGLFPNPASDQLTIQFETLSSEAVLNIIDQLNRVVWTAGLKPGQQNEKLDLATIPVTNGMYFIVIEIDGNQLIKRFVVNR